MTQSSSSESNAQQMAQNEVQNNYPNVYRSDEDLRNHAFAIAQQQVESVSPQAGEGTFAVQNFADAYMTAYNQAVQQRDAQS